MKRLLVVDDDRGSRNLARVVLEGSGYEVIIATTAEEALETLETRCPRLALVDLQLPKMNGFELTSLLTARGVTVICWSANPSDRERALAAGARCYVEKPIDIDQLDATVCELVQ